MSWNRFKTKLFFLETIIVKNNWFSSSSSFFFKANQIKSLSNSFLSLNRFYLLTLCNPFWAFAVINKSSFSLLLVRLLLNKLFLSRIFKNCWPFTAKCSNNFNNWKLWTIKLLPWPDMNRDLELLSWVFVLCFKFGIWFNRSSFSLWTLNHNYSKTGYLDFKMHLEILVEVTCR